jgi:hypothetical protein
MLGDESEAIMKVTGDLVRAMNPVYADLKLEPARMEELPVELEQLRTAIEAVQPRVEFDIDPFDFQVALLEIAAGGGK